MAVRIPRANTAFSKLDNTNLRIQGQNVVNGLTAAVGDYPTPPVDPVALQALVNTYATDLAASIGGTKQQRKQMAASRLALRNALRSDASYVNTTAWNFVEQGESYADVSTSITSTGYILGLNPSPVGPLNGPFVKSSGSPAPGQWKLILIKVPGAKSYACQLVDDTIGETTFVSLPNTRVLFTGLISGHTYVAKLATVGTTPGLNYTTQVVQIIT